MPIFNLFSKRQEALTAEPSDILIYDRIPSPIRVQIVLIFQDSFGKQRESYPIGHQVERGYKSVCEILCREYGLFRLNDWSSFEDQLHNFILQEKEVEKVLDAIELSMTFVTKWIENESNDYQYNTIRRLNGPEAIHELNERFKANAIGYQFEAGEIIKVDSTYIHSQIVKPTLQLLFNPKFAGANEEYLKAHEHYRHGRNKECLTECLKAFESTMKIICNDKGWHYNQNDTATPLVNAIIANNLIPTHLQTQINSFRSLLQSGIPTIRNRVGGHGQGATPTTADDETTRYALNLTGTNLIYLIELSGL